MGNSGIDSPGVEAARGLADSSGPGVDGRCAGTCEVHVQLQS